MEKLLRKIKSFIPPQLFSFVQPVYHYLLAFWGAVQYGFPSRNIYVVGVTGTKGKTTTTELVAAILEKAGFKVALANTNQFKIGSHTEKNFTKRSMLGRTMLQQFLRKAVRGGCEYVVIEMTSEGAKQFRHKFIDLDALIFTNLSPEHIESHGSYENYVAAKLRFAHALEKGNSKKHTIVANRNDKEAEKFLAVRVGNKCTFGIEDVEITKESVEGTDLMWRGVPIHLKIPGEFNILNALAAATFAESLDVKTAVIKQALEEFNLVRGRMERIDMGQDFTVIVDYAHTADSLDRAYSVYNGVKKICIIGGTGGGRDVAKREIMGAVTDKHCEHIVLTTEDPYDEDPADIAKDVALGIKTRPHEFILSRRDAMRRAFQLAKPGHVVFMTGKGAGPYIMGPNGLRTPWDDATVAREELAKLGFKK